MTIRNRAAKVAVLIFGIGVLVAGLGALRSYRMMPLVEAAGSTRVFEDFGDILDAVDAFDYGQYVAARHTGS